jgi:hypothetical protein
VWIERRNAVWNFLLLKFANLYSRQIKSVNAKVSSDWIYSSLSPLLNCSQLKVLCLESNRWSGTLLIHSSCNELFLNLSCEIYNKWGLELVQQEKVVKDQVPRNLCFEFEQSKLYIIIIIIIIIIIFSV